MLSTIDLLVLTRLDILLFVFKISRTFLAKQGALLRRSTVLNRPLPLVFPGLGFCGKGELRNLKQGPGVPSIQTLC